MHRYHPRARASRVCGDDDDDAAAPRALAVGRPRPPIRGTGVRARIRDDDRARDDAQSMAKMSTMTARASSAPSRASPAPSRRRPCVTINLLTTTDACVSYTTAHGLYI